MGACCSAPGPTAKYRPGMTIHFLLLGLDGGGATTILYRLKLGKMIVTVPTLGSVEETLRWSSNDDVLFHDLGGTDKLRPLWPMYQEGVHGIIYVADAADPNLMEMNRHELRKFFRAATQLHQAPLLVFANKQDVPGAMSTDEVKRALALDELPVRVSLVVPCSAANGNGLRDGVDWIVNEVKSPTSLSRVSFPGRGSLSRIMNASKFGHSGGGSGGRERGNVENDGARPPTSANEATS